MQPTHVHWFGRVVPFLHFLVCLVKNQLTIVLVENQLDLCRHVGNRDKSSLLKTSFRPQKVMSRFTVGFQSARVMEVGLYRLGLK